MSDHLSKVEAAFSDRPPLTEEESEAGEQEAEKEVEACGTGVDDPGPVDEEIPIEGFPVQEEPLDVGSFGKPKIPSSLLDPHRVLGKTPILPGYEGVPFRGRTPDLKRDDPDHKQPREGYQAFVNVLDLSNEQDLQFYQQVSQLATNGYAVISVEEREWVPENKSWSVLLRWLNRFTYQPRFREDV